MMHDEHVRIYLNDHLAGSVNAIELIEHCLKHTPSGSLSTFLAALKTEIEEDQQVLRDLHARIGGEENAAKKATAWLADKVNRAKMDHALTGYSDLSRLEELEELMLGIRGKLALWTSLEAVTRPGERFSDVDFRALQQRARHQHDQVEHHRVEAARKALITQPEAAASGS